MSNIPTMLINGMVIRRIIDLIGTRDFTSESNLDISDNMTKKMKTPKMQTIKDHALCVFANSGIL
jgi:hypothetical protein